MIAKQVMNNEIYQTTPPCSPRNRMIGVATENATFWRTGIISLKWLRANLKKPSLGLGLFLLGSCGMYFLPLIFPTNQYDPSPAGTFRYLFLSLILVTVGSALEMHASNWWLIKRKPLWVLVVIAAIGWLTVYSVINGEPVISVIYTSFPFYWLVLVPAISWRPRNWAWIWVMFLIQVPIGIAFSVNTFFVSGIATRMEINYLTGKNFLAISLYMGVFMFLFLPALRGRVLIWMTVAAFGFQLLQAFFYSSRLPLLLIPVEILLILFIYFRLYGVGAASRRIVAAAMPLFLLSVVLLATNGADWAGLFSKGYEALRGRMLEKGTLANTILENERWYESQSVLATMDPADWLIGQSLSARWSAAGLVGAENRRMVHNTWLNAFYWGGILLFLAITIPIFGALRVFLRSRNPISLVCASYLLLIYLKFPAYLITTATHEWILFCLALGVCVWEEYQLDVAKRLVSGGQLRGRVAFQRR